MLLRAQKIPSPAIHLRAGKSDMHQSIKHWVICSTWSTCDVNFIVPDNEGKKLKKKKVPSLQGPLKRHPYVIFKFSASPRLLYFYRVELFYHAVSGKYD